MCFSISLSCCGHNRYRKICQPFEWQITIAQSKIIAAAIAIISLLCAIPYGILHGRQKKVTKLPGIHGYTCEFDDAYNATIWPMVNSILFISIFVFGSIPMLVFYALIGRLARRHGKASINTIITVNSHQDDVISDVTTKSTDDCIVSSPMVEKAGQTSTIVRWNETSSTLHTSLAEAKSGQQCQATITNATTAPGKTLRPEGLSRTTLMLLAVSLVFVISFLRFLTLECFKATAPRAFSSLSGPSLVLFHLFHRSFLINSAANPIIYSVCNIKFRKECLKLFSCS
ncbi:unnamed protein product [Lymnaea stagnalis]|uniref:G-protein coupled receptors family 1 profile domain-containing protein n=1 Tax=Lymnaea stagnalis TaxID=6523 RepID=A0AAV2IC64_LYMST